MIPIQIKIYFTIQLQSPDKSPVKLLSILICGSFPILNVCWSCAYSFPCLKQMILNASFSISLSSSYHCFSPTVLRSKEKIETNCYKFKTKHGSFVTLQSQWFSFVNPWTKEVEYIVSTNTVISWVYASVSFCIAYMSLYLRYIYSILSRTSHVFTSHDKVW